MAGSKKAAGLSLTETDIVTLLHCEARNPMQAIYGTLGVIERRADRQDEMLDQAVRLIGEATRQLRDLFNEFEEFVRRISAAGKVGQQEKGVVRWI